METTTTNHAVWEARLSSAKNGFMLNVSGTTNAGPEKIRYSLEKAVPQGFNPLILLLKVSPKPTPGSQTIHLAYEEQVASETTYTSVQIIDRDGSTEIKIEIPK